MLPTITTERLRLKPIASSDLDRVHGLLILPDVRRFLCDDTVLDRAQVEGLIREAAAWCHEALACGRSLPTMRPGLGSSVCSWSPESHPGLDPISSEVEPVIALHPQAWGRGYAAEALRQAAAYARDDLHLSRLVALVDKPNLRSHRLLTRVGFEILGEGSGPKHPLRAYSLDLPKRRLDSAGVGS